jgi:hypothetical protein
VAVEPGIGDEPGQEAFGLVDEAGDQGDGGQVVAEPGAAAPGERGADWPSQGAGGSKITLIWLVGALLSVGVCRLPSPPSAGWSVLDGDLQNGNVVDQVGIGVCTPRVRPLRPGPTRWRLGSLLARGPAADAGALAAHLLTVICANAMLLSGWGSQFCVRATAATMAVPVREALRVRPNLAVVPTASEAWPQENTLPCLVHPAVHDTCDSAAGSVTAAMILLAVAGPALAAVSAQVPVLPRQAGRAGQRGGDVGLG